MQRLLCQQQVVRSLFLAILRRELNRDFSDVPCRQAAIPLLPVSEGRMSHRFTPGSKVRHALRVRIGRLTVLQRTRGQSLPKLSAENFPLIQKSTTCDALDNWQKDSFIHSYGLTSPKRIYRKSYM